MAKDDFDINFDFDQEYDFDPKAFLADGEFDENMDFSDQDLTDAPEAAAGGEDDFDLDLDALLGIGGEEAQDDAPVDVPSFVKRESQAAHYTAGGYGSVPELPKDAVPSNLEEEPEPPQVEEIPEEPQEEEAASAEPEAEKPQRRRRERAPKEPKERKEIKPPAFLQKFYDIYFAPALRKETFEEPQDPSNPRRRRRKSKVQIFKEVYLPPIVVCLCLILVLSFAIGSLSNFLEERKLQKEVEDSRLDSSVSAAEQAQSMAQRALEQAAVLALNYDYEGAIDTLDAFLTTVQDVTAYPELNAKRSEYVTGQTSLREIQDPSQIPNLSFHVLINDMVKAKQDPEYGGLYNRNFVTTQEFSNILGALYNNNYVLVDFNSFTESNGENILPKSIKLPEGKKPIMLTETLVNYFAYMVDGNGDGEADANGDSFASRLVVDDNGDIKAEYVTSEGTKVGNYDFVPILEDFIKEHPDFSYQGARATLAVTGYEGIFGYRVNTSYQADKGQAFRDAEVAGAKKLVSALRDKGYTLACFTYGNEDYRKINANQITADLQLWTQQITPIIGNVDVMVYAREADISDYSGNAFTVMYTSGFRYFVTNGATPSTEVNTTYVRQKRLMVTGNALAWKQDMFSGIFDPNSVIDMTSRVEVPN